MVEVAFTDSPGPKPEIENRLPSENATISITSGSVRVWRTLCGRIWSSESSIGYWFAACSAVLTDWLLFHFPRQVSCKRIPSLLDQQSLNRLCAVNSCWRPTGDVEPTHTKHSVVEDLESKIWISEESNIQSASSRILFIQASSSSFRKLRIIFKVLVELLHPRTLSVEVSVVSSSCTSLLRNSENHRNDVVHLGQDSLRLVASSARKSIALIPLNIVKAKNFKLSIMKCIIASVRCSFIRCFWVEFKHCFRALHWLLITFRIYLSAQE